MTETPRTGDLFEDAERWTDRVEPPIARAADPQTSHTAAAQQNASGTRASDKDKILDLVREKPGLTANEYGEILFKRGMSWFIAANMPRKRISDLIHDDEIYADATRVCTVSKRRAHTYRATKTGRAG